MNPSKNTQNTDKRNPEKPCMCACRRKQEANNPRPNSSRNKEIEIVAGMNGERQAIRLIPKNGRMEIVGPTQTNVQATKSGCINPTGCANLNQGIIADTSFFVMPAEDRMRLEEAIKEACDSVNNPRTLDDVEELAEIQSFTEIQRKLAALINDKRTKLERRRAKRESELLEQKQDFHKRVMDRVSTEQRELQQTQQGLLGTLKNQRRCSCGDRDGTRFTLSSSNYNSRLRGQVQSTLINNME